MHSPSLLLIFAHPDDESFVCGGTVALATSAGIPVFLITATPGDAGRSGELAVSGEELGTVRVRELADACAFLGIREHVMLGYGDGRLGEAPFDEAVGRVVELIRRWRPSVAVTFGREGGSNAHRDHRAICRIATAAVLAASDPRAYAGSAEQADGAHAVSKLYYATARRGAVARGGEPFDAPTTRVDISSVVDRKMAAFALHRTQATLLPRLREWISDSGDAELYVRSLDRRGIDAGVEESLFTGLGDA